MKKRGIYCGQCQALCQTFKKGKRSKVIVCPTHGIIAHNPVSWGNVAGGATTGAAIGSFIPGIGTGIGAAIGGGASLIKGLRSKETSQEVGEPSKRITPFRQPSRNRLLDLIQAENAIR